MDELLIDEPEPTQDETQSKRRRRSRRRKKRPASNAEAAAAVPVERAPSLHGRRQVVEVSEPMLSVPASGRNPSRKRNSRAKRTAPASAVTKRRRLSRTEVDDLTTWLAGMPDALLANLYKGIGGQPGRVQERDRMVQLASRAISQGSRLGAIIENLSERDHNALTVLLQCGGIAQASEFHHTLNLAYGGQERDWTRSLTTLAERGLVAASHVVDGDFFYVIPDPLFDAFVEVLKDALALPAFTHDDIRLIEHKAFSPPLDFSVTTLSTYIAQYGIRLTQRQDVHRHDQDALDTFFAQLWEPNSELFQFHLDFLMMHGMISSQGEGVRLNREVVEEWLQFEPEDQRDLLFRALDKRFEFGEWVLWAVHAASGDWVAERPLTALYRHWKRGKEWQRRFKQGNVISARQSERDSFTFAPLVQCGLLEMGQWGQEKLYRLTPRALALLEPVDEAGFDGFYLTPDFKVMAPAGLAPVLLFRLGEIAQLDGCDRANTYRITEESIEAALAAGWTRDDVLQFLRDNSKLGLPENVEVMLKGWIGHRGDVQFHDALLLSVHRSQIRRFETHRRIKPLILHRFTPGLYAVDRSRQQEIMRVLEEIGFSPTGETRTYPGTQDAAGARVALQQQLADAREFLIGPTGRDTNLVDPGSLVAVPGARMAKLGVESAPVEDAMQELSLVEVQGLMDRAINERLHVKMVYVARNGQKLECEVQPQRLAFKDATPVMVGVDLADLQPRTYLLDRVERIKVEARDV